MTQSSTHKPIPSTHTISYDEQILVVKRATLFPHNNPWHGMNADDLDSYVTIIKKEGEYISRSLAEADPTYKQIIPYLIFTHQGRYFLMQRASTASEQRLRNKLSLGIGGHVNKKDMEGATLFDWARREFHEEVEYKGELAIEPLGLVNDDSNDVGKVHLGLVLLLKGDSDQISIKSELKSGSLHTVEECIALRGDMESWSAIALQHLHTL